MTPTELEAYDAMMHDRDQWKERSERLESLFPSGAVPLLFSIFRIMIKRPINPQFSSAVIEGRKFTTIRSKPWPCWKPIMLYHWSGAAYRSKQVDVVAIEVEETLELIVTHDRDGGIVFSRDKIDGIPIHQTEGFEDAGKMQEWFSKVVPVGKTVELALMRFRLLNDQTLPTEGAAKYS